NQYPDTCGSLDASPLFGLQAVYGQQQDCSAIGGWFGVGEGRSRNCILMCAGYAGRVLSAPTNVRLDGPVTQIPVGEVLRRVGNGSPICDAIHCPQTGCYSAGSAAIFRAGVCCRGVNDLLQPAAPARDGAYLWGDG